ncbi:STAS domain-containing protein [Alkalihalobacillus pseudalcaliphilus]|uniref:STAS domain-containing protein n=1 Tax=Alkalihalobacillus pseudalcaliphilus TaxID=79884 RepID=UPI00064D8AFA|nr:STAS domain-containing protein [Alkalihalobacillus pseudalcaliphilus]KMK75396.1 hypothetical protein AB990_08735 [Alkalihalobacillus pseudalcaliphilus]
MPQLKKTHLPLPSYTINREYDIIDFSQEAYQHFGYIDSLIHIIDEGSLTKVKEWLQPNKNKVTLEINVIQSDGVLLLALLHATWHSEEEAQVVLIFTDKQLATISHQLMSLRERLNHTNMELVREKEKLQHTLEENYRLSAPCIKMSNHFTMIPLYGDLTAEKMRFTQEKVLENLYYQDPKNVLIDFTAIGTIYVDGLPGLELMLQSISLMGIRIYLVGVNEKTTKELHKLDVHKWRVEFIQSMKVALQKVTI